MAGKETLLIEWGIATIQAGNSGHQVTFNREFYNPPAVIITSATTQGGGSVNAFAHQVTKTGFKVHLSNDEPAVDITWRAILDRQKKPWGNGSAALETDE